MAYTIAIANQKGGVGKTATSGALAYGLSRRGYKVLLVDADPQCNTTDAFNAAVEEQATLYDLMVKEAETHEAIQHTEYLDVIANDDQLNRADNLFTNAGREYLIKEALEPIQNQYDFIIIDTLPGLGIMLLNALTAADGVVIPLGADRDSLQGTKQLYDTINAVKTYSNQSLALLGLLVTRYTPNTNLAKAMIHSTLSNVEQMMETKSFTSKIRETTNVKDARAHRVPLAEYNKRATAAQDYEAFIDELLADIHNIKAG